MCRPVGGSRTEVSLGGHIGPPLRGAGRYLGTNGNWRGTGPCRGRGRTVYGGVWSPRPTGATLVVRSNGPMWASAPTEGVGSFINHPGQSAHQRRTIPQSPYGRQLPLPKGALGDGGSGRRGRRPLRVRWLGPSGAWLQRRSCGCSLCIRESFLRRVKNERGGKAKPCPLGCLWGSLTSGRC